MTSLGLMALSTFILQGKAILIIFLVGLNKSLEVWDLVHKIIFREHNVKPCSPMIQQDAHIG